MAKDLLKILCERGLYLPAAHDSNRDEPSFTLLFFYAANVIALVGLIIYFIVGDKFTATCTACIYAVIQAVLYQMHKITKAKFDLKDDAIELDGGDDSKGDKK